MAHQPSATERTRRTARRAAIDGARMSRIRTFVKKVETAIDAGDADGARTALRNAQPEIQRGVTRGVLHRNTASRELSRLAARVMAVAACCSRRIALFQRPAAFGRAFFMGRVRRQCGMWWVGLAEIMFPLGW